MGISRYEWTQPSTVLHSGASLKLGTYPGRTQDNGVEEGFCAVLNTNEWGKPNMSCARGGELREETG